ncbi:MAG TPA: helix-turn-helix domain-containing protein [Bryobacteraceae bacterium]|nr:helix-turn-helix domain-containing protein [Bryobacteraceae bacterium]
MQTKFSEKVSSHREPLMTTAAVAKWLGISTRAVCLWAECKTIPALKIGRQWRFRPEEVQAWLDSSQAAKVKNPTVTRTSTARF